MALPDSLKQVNPAVANNIVYAESATDWPAGTQDANWGDADALWNGEGLTTGQARESVKFAWPTNLELEYEIHSVMEWATAPADGDTFDWHMGTSPSATVGTANPGGLTGADADFTGTAGSTLDESLEQLDYLGSLSCTNDATTVVQQQQIGTIPAPSLDNIMVVGDNNTADTTHSDAQEMGLIFVGKEIQIQDAVTT